MSENKFNAYKYRTKTKNQTGRGMYGRYRGSYMIPVNQNTTANSTPAVKTPMVSPIAATEKRAESQMKEETKLGKPRVKLIKKSIKRKKQGKQLNKKKADKKRTSSRSSTKFSKKTQRKKFSSKKTPRYQHQESQKKKGNQKLAK